MNKTKVVLCLSLMIAAAAMGQVKPGRERGFKPEQAYQLNEFDSVNLFNGNLNLGIPLGQTYNVGAGLSYSFVLRYSGNVWFYSEWMKPFRAMDLQNANDPTGCFDESEPELPQHVRRFCSNEAWWWTPYHDEQDQGHSFYFPLRDNGGLGWRLSFGELNPPMPNALSGSYFKLWKYKSPDGGERGFYPTLHEPQCKPDQPDLKPCETPEPLVLYTRDGTYLRLRRRNDTTDDRILEFPDGQRHLFKCNLEISDCKLWYIYNGVSTFGSDGLPKSNYVKFDYEPNRWIVTDKSKEDDPVRTHYVHLLPSETTAVPYVDDVDLQAFNGDRAVYDLTYDKFDGSAEDGAYSLISRPCGSQNPTPAHVRLLGRVRMASGEIYRFNYKQTSTCDEASGTLTSATLPTGGRLEWSYQNYAVNESGLATGVKERSKFDDTKRLEYTTYANELGKTTINVMKPGAADTDPWSVSTRSVHYFQTNYGKTQALPYTDIAGLTTLPVNDGRGRFLSSATYDCATCLQPARTSYVKYEFDYIAPGTAPCSTELPCQTDLNRRLASESTVFHDDGGRIVETTNSDFDGLGHYRRTIIASTFDDPGAVPRKHRETYTFFNPAAGEYKLDADGKRTGTYTMRGSNKSWILGMYDFTQVEEGEAVSVTEACFDDATGFLTRTLTDGNGILRSGNDLLTWYEPDPVTGFPASEESFGGDGPAMFDQTTHLCNIAKPGSPAAVRIDHTYEFGVRKTSKYSGVGFLSLNNTSIDRSTGLVKESLDPNGLKTTYTYDTSSRLKILTPPGTAPTTYNYDPASGGSPSTITASTGIDPDTKLEQSWEYDALGRLWREKRLMPGGTRSVRETLQDFAGRRASVSEWEPFSSATSPGAKTRFTDYDVFGRAHSVTAPDGKSTQFTFQGSRVATRTVAVATSENGTTNVSVDETRDALGRLIAVTEAKTAGSSGAKTAYGYRLGDQLTSVTMDGQRPRSFKHDSRGLLMEEDHPESGKTSYTYDARGHIRTKTTPLAQLTFNYDGAERVTDVSAAPITSLASKKLVKHFEYDGGRLKRQKRNNYLPGAPREYVVTDTFGYDVDGRINSKTTSVTDTDLRTNEFTQDFKYDTLGQPKSLQFPSCPGCPDRTPVALTWRAGLLNGMAGVGSNMVYGPAGQLLQARHENGVVDTVTPDTSGMPRPGRIETTNVKDCTLITQQPHDAVTGDDGRATFTVTTVANATVKWFEGAAPNTDRPAGDGPSFTTPVLDRTTYYWCRVTVGTSCEAKSNTVAARFCGAPRIVLPASPFTGGATSAVANQTFQLSVSAIGKNLAYRWFTGPAAQNADGTWSIGSETDVPLQTSNSLNWTYGGGTGTTGVGVEVTGDDCDNTRQSAKIALLVVKEGTVGTKQCPAPDILANLPSEVEIIPGYPYPVVRVAIHPWVPSGQLPLGLELDSNLEFIWYVNNTATTHKGSSFQANKNGISVYADVWRKCSESNYTSTSASVRTRTMFVYDRAHCPIPPVTIDQLELVLNGEAKKIHATSTWAAVKYQWYRGDSGNTHRPITTATSADFTPPVAAGTYWLRATTPCGTTWDSPTVSVTAGSCAPVHIVREPASAEIRAKAPYVLSVDTLPAAGTYEWIRVDDVHDQHVGYGRQFLLDGPLKTTAYYVKASTDCHVVDSAIAVLHVTSCEDITITAQPQTKSVVEHDDVMLHIDAGSPLPLSFQWYEGEAGDASKPMAGATANEVVLHDRLLTAKYWVRVSVAGGCEVDSNTATVYVCRKPTSPKQTVYVNSYVPAQVQWLDAAASGDNVQFQWYRGAVGDTTFKVGNNEKVVQVAPQTTESYWFRATSDCHEGTADQYDDSGAWLVTVCPVILEQPAAQYPEVMQGAQATLTINAWGADRIDWYSGAPGDITSGVLGHGATFRPVINANTSFWANVVSGVCERASDAVTVGLCTKPTVYWAPEVKTEIAAGQQQLLRVLGSTSGVYEATLTWYAGPWKDVEHSTVIAGPSGLAVQLDVAPAQTTTYWVRIAESSGCRADSPALTVKVCIPTIVTQPQTVLLDKIANPAATATLAVGATGAESYQWYIGQPGDKTHPVGAADAASGWNTATLTAWPDADTTYWVQVIGCAFPKTSAAATVRLCVKPVITSHPLGVITTGGNAPLLVSAGGTDLVYQWYKGASGDVSIPVAGATTASLNVAPATTTDYWVKVSGRCGPAVNSNTATVSVTPVIVTQPAGAFVMPGTTKTLSVVATGSPLAYQWFNGTTPINGATSSSYTTPPITASASYTVRVSSGAASVDSAPAALTLCTQPTVVWNGTKTQVTESESQVLTVSGTGSQVLYTWYTGNAGDVAGSTVIDGPGQIVQKSIAPAVTTKYWVRAGESTGCYADTTTLTVQVCVPAITAQPQPVLLDKTANPNATVTLSVTAKGGPLTYQWYIGPAGNTGAPLAGATSSALTVSPAADTTYWVRVSGSCGVTRDSAAATVTVCKVPQIAGQPSSTVVYAGNPVTLAVSATGTTLTYQWYRGVSGDTSTPMNNATASTLTVTASQTTDYWVRVNGRCGTANSNAAKVSVAPVIATQPQGGNVTKGITRTLTVAASGAQLAYQWYSGAGTAISGATGAAYTTPPINADINYWVRVYSGDAFADSSTAAFTVCQPRNAAVVSNTYISGGAITLRVDTVASGETYEWYLGESGVTATLAGGGYQINVNPVGTSRYWVRTRRADCDADSAAVTARVCYPAITAQPQSATTINTNATRTLNVTATGTAPLTYQWYIGDSGVTTSPISGATAASYTTPPLAATTKYWVQVRGAADAACAGISTNSAAATVTVCSPPAITQQPQNAVLQNSSMGVTLSVAATGTGLAYQWYQGSPGVTTTPAGTGPSVLVYPGTTKPYWVRVTGSCGTLDSAAALLSVLPAITSQPPGTMTVCQNASANFTVQACCAPLTYQWFRSVSGGAWQPFATTPSATMTITAPTNVYCTVTSGNASIDSVMTSVSVTPGPWVTVGKRTLGTNYYRLDAYANWEEAPSVGFEWFKGQLGDSSTLYATGAYFEIYSPTPQTFWVRATHSDTGCTTNAGPISIP